MAWTEQQKNAIELRDSSAIVSAAAGSGKTAVLTERLARLIADESAHVRADRIVAVTFTNDAASELRKRLDKKLREMISDDPGNSYLLRQQTLLQSAKISTINSFCFDLLRDNITEQGITSAFSILDESENELLKAQSMDELINYYSSEDYDKISFMYDKFCLKSDEKLAEVISLADRYLSSAAMRRNWIENMTAEFKKNPFETSYFKRLTANASAGLKKAVRLADECRDMLDDIFYEECPAAEKSYAQSDNDKLRAEKALEILKSGNPPTPNDIAFCTSFERLVTVKSTVEHDAELRKFYKTKRNRMIDTVKNCLGMFDGFERDFRECGEVAEILAEMLFKYQDIIWSKKCEKNAISFDDGERLVLELLAETDEKGRIIQSETARRIADFYDIIMIDEYQDSNNKQDLIFKLISKDYRLNDDGMPVYGSNAFLVGDVKQSIYKFRLANPGNFIATLKNSEPFSENPASKNLFIALNKNFRSSPEVIDFVNFIFSQLMSEECGEVCYNDDEKLYFGAEEYASSPAKQGCLTHIAFIDADSKDEQDEEQSLAEINTEAVYTADKICSMLRDKTEVTTKNGKNRPCEPSDFCVLIRKNKYAKDYVAELRKRGIEAKSEEESGYLSSREIAVLLDLLRVIDNPLLDVPLAAVMMSPMYMFELKELAYLKTLDRNGHLFTTMTGLVNGEYGNSTDIGVNLLTERCKKFLEALSSFRLCAVTMTVGELIDKIYDTTDFVSVMQIFTDGEKKRANLRALIQYAKNYESSSSLEGSGGLPGFIRYIDRIIENGTDFTQGKISSSTGNYVSVKTIHKSKGLEFPFIFLAETSAKFQFDTPPVLCSDDSRIGFVLYDQKLVRRYRTLPYRQIIEENSRDIISEEMRLLYVAMTRAKQQLFINLKCGDKQKSSLMKLIEAYRLENGRLKETAKSARCHADWIWMALMEHSSFAHIAGSIGISFEGTECPPPRINDLLFETEFVKPRFMDTEKTEEEVQEALPDPDKYEDMKSIIEYNYDRVLSETPSKLSVTQITRKFAGETDSFDFKLRRPHFAEERSELTGAERGTAIHTFFQYCDFEAAIIDPQKEIDRMTLKRYLSRPQAESINIENVIAFFSSGLYKRIQKADNIWREKKFMVAVADLDIENELMESFKKSDGMIKGIVDLIFEENGSLVLVDYKSDRRTTDEVLKERYKMQLRLYKSAMELTTDKFVAEAYLYSFELKKEIKIEL